MSVRRFHPRSSLVGMVRRLGAGVAPMTAGLALALGTAVWAQTAAGPTPSPSARGTLSVLSVQDICRLEGQGENILRGIGIVTGLKGTGDSGADLVLARPLAQIYERNGNPLEDLRELAKSKSAALVAIECVIPPQGARVGDNLDVFITTTHSATSLAGGRLFLSPLSGPLPGQGVYAFASGPIVIEEAGNPTTGRIRGGARIIHDILQPVGSVEFTLLIHPHYRSFSVADQLADTINALRAPAELGELDTARHQPVAYALDDSAVRVVIPPAERSNPTKFIAEVMTATLSPSLLRLPAQVIVNSRTGSIIVTGNVEVSAVAVAHRGLVVTTVNPPPVPTPQNPQTSTTRWTSLQTTDRASERTRIEELLAAFKALDVPVEEQIAILTQIHRAGRLHARLVIE
jgi:flagellar P-ring protein precursor FlgI